MKEMRLVSVLLLKRGFQKQHMQENYALKMSDQFWIL